VRHFDFVIDRPHARAVNETAVGNRRRRVVAALATVVLGVSAGLLILVDDVWAYFLTVVLGLGALTALWIALWAPRRLGNIEKFYAEGALIPAVVSEVKDNGTATLLALVDLSKPDTPDPRYALVSRKVHSLPGHSLHVGERVPAVAVPVDRISRTSNGDGDGHWHSASAMPIAWATRDPDVLDRARHAIDDVEWTLLTDNLALAAKVHAAETKRLLLDPHQLPQQLRR